MSGGFLSRFRQTDKRRKTEKSPSSWGVRLKISFSLCFWILLGALIVYSFGYLNQYIAVESSHFRRYGPMELVHVPDWVEPEWIDVITTAVGGGLFCLQEESARQVAEKLSTLSWLANVRIRVTPTRLQVEAMYRKPVLWIQIGTGRRFSIDSEGVVLDVPELKSGPIVELRGLPPERIPLPGRVCRLEEVSAVLALLAVLERMDEKCCPEKPLRNEIAFIDVGNWVRGKNPSLPQIVLGARDGTPIYWGAPFGKAASYLEADEMEKLSILYTFYTQNNKTLQGKVKYLELRLPVGQRPRPR